MEPSAKPEVQAVDGPTDGPGHARQWLRSTLGERGIDQTIVEDACLVVSELVTNALVHGHGVGRLRVTIDPVAIRLDVTDFVEALPVARRPVLVDEAGGMGLAIVDALSTHWGIDQFEGGKDVWAKLSLRP